MSGKLNIEIKFKVTYDGIDGANINYSLENNRRKTIQQFSTENLHALLKNRPWDFLYHQPATEVQAQKSSHTFQLCQCFDNIKA
jgi:hypothetical protein